jgi:cytochrome P450
MPIIALLTLIQLPQEDYAYLRGLAVDTAKVVGPKAAAARVKMEAYVRDRIRERREQPRNDYISTLVHAEVDERKLTGEEIFQICNLVIGGGLDTVVSMTSFLCAFLARHPEARRALRDHPEILDNAVEEVARRFGTSNLGRIVRRDLELGGVALLRDEMVVGIFPLAGLDETVNADPMRFDIFRERPRHLAFGSGPHVCVGATLARREIRIFLEEWLKRIPEFSLKPGTLPKVTSGLVNSAVELQLVWEAA